MTRRAATLEVRELVCSRGDRVLFAPTSFIAGAGDIVWMRGANGQGKTTLLRTLAGLAAPSSGTITWQRSDDIAPRLVYLAHANALKEELTVRESLRFLLDLGGAPVDDDAADVALERFGLASRRDAFVRTLSQGQRRRVALARLAAQREALPWLLDEPFDALDAGGVDVLAALIAEHAKRGGSVVLTSHLPVPIAHPVPAVVHLHEPAFA
ncbi:MAG: cytochrome c biogenesis heme-transporting ATPase CcmA [Caldimonas sp.]